MADITINTTTDSDICTVTFKADGAETTTEITKSELSEYLKG